jgi:hypothetical protein
MAATQITLTGWVNQVKEFDWGTTLTVSVANRIKNQSTGEWETASRDYYDVVLNDGVQLGPIKVDDQVTVNGTFKLGKTYQKKDGSTAVELKVRANSIGYAEPNFNDASFPKTAQRGEAALRDFGAEPF